ncbi:hypothetical protein BJ508DRAFT_219104, partial [Ascobolus immersus RN42]
MTYLPRKEYDGPDKKYRIVGDLFTTDWWWNKQARLPKGHFLIPLIFASDGTFLTNFCGDKDIDPINFTVGNIDPKVRNCPSRQAWRCLGIFPERPKRSEKQSACRAEERLEASDIVQCVLELLLKTLPKMSRKGIKIMCPDGKMRIGHPVLACWIADYVEYNKLFSQVYGSCTICKTPLE